MNMFAIIKQKLSVLFIEALWSGQAIFALWKLNRMKTVFPEDTRRN